MPEKIAQMKLAISTARCGALGICIHHCIVNSMKTESSKLIDLPGQGQTFIRLFFQLVRGFRGPGDLQQKANEAHYERENRFCHGGVEEVLDLLFDESERTM